MNNSLSSALPRRASRAVAVLTLSATMAFGYLVGIAQAHDPRLDEAFQALQKAYALVEASQTGGATPQVQHQFDAHRQRALELITRAMEAVVKTAEVTEGSSGFGG